MAHFDESNRADELMPCIIFEKMHEALYIFLMLVSEPHFIEFHAINIIY